MSTPPSGDLVLLVHETIETYRPHLESSGFTIQSQLPGSSIMLNGDRDALAQVVVNLLSNAEKYAGERKDVELHSYLDGAHT